MTGQLSTRAPLLALVPLRIARSESDFLPAALEVIDTPLSPIRTTLLLTVCALVAAALAWACLGRVDVLATAQGKVQPVGRTKVVEPFAPGKVVALPVTNGQHVKAGDLLLDLDDRDALADEAVLGASLASLRAETLRRTAALAAAGARDFHRVPPIAWPSDIPPEVGEREERVLAGDLGQIGRTLDSLDAQRIEKLAGRDRLQATIDSQVALLATLKERVDMASTLLARNSGSKVNLIEARQNFQFHTTTLVTEQGQLAEAEAGLRTAVAEGEKHVAAYVADNAQKLATVRRDADEAALKLGKSKLKTTVTKLRSPIDGIVQDLTVTSVGQVVSAGEQVMRVVPDDERLEVEAYMPNGDVGFVKPGQPVIVKVEAFPFTRYGTLDGRVERVAADAIPDDRAMQSELDPTSSDRAQPFGAQKVRGLVYPLLLSLDRRPTGGAGAPLPLHPGMAVTVEVKTGRRRIIDYLLSPLEEVGSTALTER